MAVPKNLIHPVPLPTLFRFENTPGRASTSKKAVFARISSHAWSLPQANRGHAKPKNRSSRKGKVTQQVAKRKIDVTRYEKTVHYAVSEFGDTS